MTETEPVPPTLPMLLERWAPCCRPGLRLLGDGPYRGTEPEMAARAMLWLFQVPAWSWMRPLVMGLIGAHGLAPRWIIAACNDQNPAGDARLAARVKSWGAEIKLDNQGTVDVIDRCVLGELPRAAFGDVLCVLVRLADTSEHVRKQGPTTIRTARKHGALMEILYYAVLNSFLLMPNSEGRRARFIHEAAQCARLTLAQERWAAIPEGVS